jgi:WD40 repeat protein
MVKWVPGTDYQLVSCSYDDTLKLWDYEDDEYFCKQTLTEHASTVWCIAFSADGKYLVSGSEDKTIKVFSKTDQDKWALSLNISGYHERSIYTVDLFRDSLLIASVASSDPGWR